MPRDVYNIDVYYSTLAVEEITARLAQVFPEVIYVHPHGAYTACAVIPSQWPLSPEQEEVIRALGGRGVGHFTHQRTPEEQQARDQKLREEYLRDQEEEQARYQHWLERTHQEYPHARYYVMAFVQNYTGQIVPAFVTSSEGYPFTEEGHKQAKRDTASFEHKVGRVMHDYVYAVQLAESYEAAKQGLFLDE